MFNMFFCIVNLSLALTFKDFLFYFKLFRILRKVLI